MISCFHNAFARQRAAFPFPLPLSPFPCFSFPAVLCLQYFGTTKKTNFTVNYFTLQMFYIESRRNIKTFATLFWPPQENQNETVTGIAYERCISFSVVLVSDDKYPGESLTCVQSSNSDNIVPIEYRGRSHADPHWQFLGIRCIFLNSLACGHHRLGQNPGRRVSQKPS